MARHGNDGSILGPATKVTGRLSGAGSLRVEGHVHGDISITGEAHVAEGGRVEGNVTAASLEVAGSLLGDVNVRGAVVIRGGAVVRGDLRGAEVSIEPGSRVSVRLDTDFELDLVPAPKRR